MKIIKLIYLACMLIFMTGIPQKASAQRKYAPNPFPVTTEERDSLIKEAQSRVVSIGSKYSTKNIDEWSAEDREGFLKAKAIKMLLIDAPDFYRKYNVDKPTIVKDICKRKKRNGYAFYHVKFQFDPKKERLRTTNREMADIKIWADNGAFYETYIRVANCGLGTYEPGDEDKIYDSYWQKKERPKGIRYRTGYERSRVRD